MMSDPGLTAIRPNLFVNGVGLAGEAEITEVVPLPNANSEVFGLHAPALQSAQPPTLRPTPLQVEDVDQSKDIQEECVMLQEESTKSAVRIKVPSISSGAEISPVANLPQRESVKKFRQSESSASTAPLRQSTTSGVCKATSVKGRASTGSKMTSSSSVIGHSTTFGTLGKVSNRFLSVVMPGFASEDSLRGSNRSVDRSFMTVDRVKSTRQSELLSLAESEEHDGCSEKIIHHCRLLRMHTWLFMEEPWDTLASTGVHGAVVLIIIASIFHRIALHDEPESHDTRSTNIWNVAVNIVLCVDLLVRFWSYPLQCRWLSDPKNMIDLMNLLPFFINDVFDVPGRVSSLAFLEWLTTFETFLRLLKLTRYFTGWQLLFHALNTSAQALLIPCLFLLLIVSLGSCGLYVCETLHARSEHASKDLDVLERMAQGLTTIRTLPDAIHFSVICILSIGTGPFYAMEAVSVGGKIVVVSMMAFGMLFIAMPIAIVGACFSQTWFDQDRIVLLYKVKSRLQAQGYTPADLYDVFKEVDADNSGEIEFSEFKRMIDTFNLPALNMAKCRALFQYFDHDQDNAISFLDFAQTLFPELQFDEEDDMSQTSSDLGYKEPYEELLPPIGEASFNVDEFDSQDGSSHSPAEHDQENRQNMNTPSPPVSPAVTLHQDRQDVARGGMKKEDAHNFDVARSIDSEKGNFSQTNSTNSYNSDDPNISTRSLVPSPQQEKVEISRVVPPKPMRSSDMSLGPSRMSELSLHDESNIVSFPKGLKRLHSNSSVVSHCLLPKGQSLNVEDRKQSVEALLKKIDQKIDRQFEQIIRELHNRPAGLFAAPHFDATTSKRQSSAMKLLGIDRFKNMAKSVPHSRSASARTSMVSTHVSVERHNRGSVVSGKASVVSGKGSVISHHIERSSMTSDRATILSQSHESHGKAHAKKRHTTHTKKHGDEAPFGITLSTPGPGKHSRPDTLIMKRSAFGLPRLRP